MDAGGGGGHLCDRGAGGDGDDKSTETRYMEQLPPRPQVHNVDIVGRIFGGTMRDKTKKEKKIEEIEKLEEKTKFMMILILNLG